MTISNHNAQDTNRWDAKTIKQVIIITVHFYHKITFHLM